MAKKPKVDAKRMSASERMRHLAAEVVATNARNAEASRDRAQKRIQEAEAKAKSEASAYYKEKIEPKIEEQARRGTRQLEYEIRSYDEFDYASYIADHLAKVLRSAPLNYTVLVGVRIFHEAWSDDGWGDSAHYEQTLRISW